MADWTKDWLSGNARFKRVRVRRQKRAALIEDHPFCANCGTQVSDDDERYPKASLCDDRLSCPKCIAIVKRQAHAEHGHEFPPTEGAEPCS